MNFEQFSRRCTKRRLFRRWATRARILLRVEHSARDMGLSPALEARLARVMLDPVEVPTPLDSTPRPRPLSPTTGERGNEGGGDGATGSPSSHRHYSSHSFRVQQQVSAPALMNEGEMRRYFLGEQQQQQQQQQLTPTADGSLDGPNAATPASRLDQGSRWGPPFSPVAMSASMRSLF